MREWITEIQNIVSLDPVWREKARERLRKQTRPEGSLGVLESLLERLVAIQKKETPAIHPRPIYVFAADHGVTEEDVSLYPREVTKAMVLNFLKDKATISSLARYIGSHVRVVDVGVDADFQADGRLINAKIRRGTRNMTREAAMTPEELNQALQVGWDLMQKAKTNGMKLIGLGEMGIGNTTAASAVNAALTGQPVELMTGRGTGLGDDMLQHKIEVIKRAHALHAKNFTDPLKILQCVGGYEIAAMTGAILSAARFSLPVIVDGWIVSAAALTAIRLNPKVLDYLFFAHQSDERGHRYILEMLEVKPILNLSMRLGEASGAALAMSILEAAVRIYNEVGTFADTGVPNRKDQPQNVSARAGRDRR